MRPESHATVSGIPGAVHYDSESGLNYNYFRDYDPAIGRYITADRVSMGWHVDRYISELGVSGRPPLDTNPYLYAADDPMQWIDPNGLWSVSVGGYLGRGGSIAFGREGGKWFISGGAGVGLGGGIKFYPTGDFPDSKNACSCSDRAFIGSSASASASLGPASIEYRARAGGLISHDCDGKLQLEYYEKGGWEWSLRGKAGWGLSLGGGLNIIDGGVTW